MLNEVLAVCIADAVVVVIATILGAVDRLWKAVAAIIGR
jgi:Flp pilus assembly pilin Flp